MFKKLVILLAAVSVMSACNDSKSKKKSDKVGNKPTVEAQGQDTDNNTDAADPIAKAQEELEANIDAGDWCMTTQVGGDGVPQITKIISDKPMDYTEMEEDNVTVITISETMVDGEKKVAVVSKVAGEMIVEGDQYALTTWVPATETLPSYVSEQAGTITFVTDKHSKTMILGGTATPTINAKGADFYYACDADQKMSEVNVEPGTEDQVVEEQKPADGKTEEIVEEVKGE